MVIRLSNGDITRIWSLLPLAPTSGRLLILVTTCARPQAFPTTTKTDMDIMIDRIWSLQERPGPKGADDLSIYLSIYLVSCLLMKDKILSICLHLLCTMTHWYPDALRIFFGILGGTLSLSSSASSTPNHNVIHNIFFLFQQTPCCGELFVFV